MESKALLVVNYRQLALVYEQMGAVATDDSQPTSERHEAEELHRTCAELMGRDNCDIDESETA